VYFVAQVGGLDVAGVGALPDCGGAPAAVWSTSVCVDDADAAVGRVTIAGGSVLLGPLDALPAGRLAVIADPSGAPLAVWEARDRAGALLVNQPGTWAMSSLHSPDPAGASTFYAAVFGWQAEPIGPGAAITLFRLPGYVGGEPGQLIPRDVVGVMTPTEATPTGPAIPPHWSVNFQVEDTDAVAVHAAGLGGAILMPPTDSLGFRSAVVVDPQGATFAISQVVPPS
jgi:predicted enzyme related to lactoylglutathione lyase